MRSINFLTNFTLSLLIITAAGCSSVANVNKLDNLRPNEAFVFGRLRILKNGEDITKYSNLLVNQAGKSGWGTAKQLFPSEGVICAQFPVGDNYFFHIISRKGVFSAEYRYAFKPNEATFQLPEQGGVYYIGDITIDWTPPKSKSDKAANFVTGAIYGGIIGGLIGIGTMPYEGGEAVIMVHDNLAEDQKLFSERFQTDKTLVPAFLQINTDTKPEMPKMQ